MSHSTSHRIHRFSTVALCFVLVAALAVIPATGAQALTYPPTEVTRHAGADRYETAALASQKAFPDPAQVDSIVVATGESFPDALAAAPFAGFLNAPVLLTRSDALSPAVTREIIRLNPNHIYVLGGEGSVAPAVITALEARGSDVTRIGGEDRYETAVLLAEELTERAAATGEGGAAPTEAFLVAGDGFADALSVGAIASQLQAPILLAGSDSLDAVTIEYLKDSAIKTVTVVGGTGSVSDVVRESLGGLGVTSTNRIGGQDRYQTSGLGG
jgi:N-acetylmuramoyl-L-alanine amidase